MTDIPVPFATTEESLNHIFDLLQCAAVTAYENGDRLKGTDRHLAFSVVHLIELAKTRIDEHLGRLPTGPTNW